MYNKKLYTVSEAAKYLGVSASTLLKWESVGKIISVKTPSSNQKFFPKEQLNKLLWRIENRILTSTRLVR